MITIQKTTAEKVGSCTDCSNPKNEIVYNISLNGFSFRLCSQCMTELKNNVFLADYKSEQNFDR